MTDKKVAYPFREELKQRLLLVLDFLIPGLVAVIVSYATVMSCFFLLLSVLAFAFAKVVFL